MSDPSRSPRLATPSFFECEACGQEGIPEGQRCSKGCGYRYLTYPDDATISRLAADYLDAQRRAGGSCERGC